MEVQVKNVQSNLRIHPEVKAILDEIARKERRRHGLVIEDAIRQYKASRPRRPTTRP